MTLPVHLLPPGIAHGASAGRPSRASKPRCSTCGNVMRNGRRCGPCVGATPNPGTPAWSRWTRGICRTIRARLNAANLWQHDMAAIKALVFDEGQVPAEVAPLLADIAALPCSFGRYNVALERALNRVGLSLRPPRPRLLVRVATPRLRVDVAEDTDVAAELEATAEAAVVAESQV